MRFGRKISSLRICSKNFIFFVVLFLAAVSVYFQNSKATYQIKNAGVQKIYFKEFTSHSYKRKGLLILTLPRSGSTFTGQYFNERADTFYVYEPLLPFGDSCEEVIENDKVKYLRDIFHCNIRNQKDIYKDITNFSLSRKLAFYHCFGENFCFRYRSRALCSGENCKNGNNETCEGCGPVDVTSASRKCRSSKLVVVKVVRLCNLDRLKSLLTDPELDLKIIHLVRDPRGMLRSRMRLIKIEGKKYLKTNSSCEIMEKGITYATDRDEEWIKGRYKILRYEDLCENPLLMGRHLYKFTGLTMTSQMMSWILNNTQGVLFALQDPYSIRLVKKYQTKLQRVAFHPYTTNRNSSATWRKWKTILNVNQVMSVQSVCKNVMTYLGYRLIEDQNQLKDSSFEILNKFCPNQEYSFC